MTSNIQVSKIMSKGVIVANMHSTYTQVMRFFTEYKIQHLPVAEGDKIIGIISVTDMMDYLARMLDSGKVDTAALDSDFKVSEVMTANPVTISPDDHIDKAVEMLFGYGFHALPVTQNGTIQGILTNKDLIRMLQWEYTHVYA